MNEASSAIRPWFSSVQRCSVAPLIAVTEKRSNESWNTRRPRPLLIGRNWKQALNAPTTRAAPAR